MDVTPIGRFSPPGTEPLDDEPRTRVGQPAWSHELTAGSWGSPASCGG